MKDSDSDTTSSPAYDNLLSALEMYEGELWRSSNPNRGRAIARLQYVRRMLDTAEQALEIPLKNKDDGSRFP